jgi:type I restriction enzyme S subunit
MNLNQYASNTAAQPGLSVSTVLNVRATLPPLNEQEQISLFLDEKVSMIDAIMMEKQSLIMELESYKKSLIYEAVTGKRRVV